MSMPVGSIPQANYGVVVVSETALSPKENIGPDWTLAFNQVMDQKAKTLEKEVEVKAEAIDAYFRVRNMPLEGMGLKMVQEAEKNGLDWRLLPAISVVESTGGKNACKNAAHSFMGWGSCKINFNSDEEAIEIVAKNLGGNNPNTDQHYADKTTKEILQKYNPPSVAPNYAEKVMRVMNEIGENEMVIVNV